MCVLLQILYIYSRVRIAASAVILDYAAVVIRFKGKLYQQQKKSNHNKLFSLSLIPFWYLLL